MAVADDVVTVRQNLERGYPGERDAGQVILLKLPDDLLLRGDFQNTVAIAGGDQRVAILQTDSSEELIPERFRAMAALAWFIEQRDFKLPDDFARLAVVLAQRPVALVAGKIISVFQLASQASVPMRWAGRLSVLLREATFPRGRFR